MATLNEVKLIGHVGDDVKSFQMKDGGIIVNMTVATSHHWADKNTGDKKEATEWHRVVLYGFLANDAVKNVKKGSKVYVSGHLKTRKWTDKAGVERYATEIVANELLVSIKGEVETKPAAKATQAPQQEKFDDDIPF